MKTSHQPGRGVAPWIAPLDRSSHRHPPPHYDCGFWHPVMLTGCLSNRGYNTVIIIRSLSPPVLPSHPLVDMSPMHETIK